MTGVPIQGERTDTQGMRSWEALKTGLGIEVVPLQTKECGGLPGTPETGKGEKGFLPRAFRMDCLADWHLDFRLLASSAVRV